MRCEHSNWNTQVHAVQHSSSVQFSLCAVNEALVARRNDVTTAFHAGGSAGLVGGGQCPLAA